MPIIYQNKTKLEQEELDKNISEEEEVKKPKFSNTILKLIYSNCIQIKLDILLNVPINNIDDLKKQFPNESFNLEQLVSCI